MGNEPISGKSIVRWVGAALLITAVLVAVFKLAGSGAPSSGTAVVSSLPPVTAADWVRGPATSTVTLIEYSDFQCPACEAYHPLVEQVVTQYQLSVKYVYRHFPLPQHPQAEPAARAAEAAGKQGKFWDMYHLLFEHNTDWVNQSGYEKTFESYASRLGLDMAKYRADYNSSEVVAIVQKDEQGGIAAGVNATPTFFLNGVKLLNPTSLSAFQEVIDAALGSTTKTTP